MFSYVQETDLDDEDFAVGDIRFNPDGTKMFLLSQNNKDDFAAIYEYNLSKPFDITTKSYTGDSERCILTNGGDDDLNTDTAFGLDFTNDGMKIFVGNGALNGRADGDRVYRFDLTSPYDVSTCSFVNQTSNLDTLALQNGSNAGDREAAIRKNLLRGIEISNDGTKLFTIFHEFGGTPDQTRLLEYQLSTPFDLTTISLVLTAGIELQAQTENPKGLRFSPDGKRLWTVDHQNSATGKDITQISLDVAFSTASFTIDGTVSIAANNAQPSGIAFSTNGLKMFVGGDDTREVEEYHLVCPFNIISGKCPPITENKDRTGIAMAQIEIAKRTIDHSTDTALNRLKWIRRNKDKQNLTNLNIDFNFNNQRLASLTEVVRTSAVKKKAKDKDEKRDVFYWSEGSVAIGRVGDTSISSTKEINTKRITVGADRFIDEKALRGLAFSVGRNNVDVGNKGSNVDADTYNLTYYSTSPMKDNEKFVDTIIGIGKIHSDILTVLDGKKLTANRRGKQIFGTIRIKDEIKGDKFTFIPSGRFDIGHTLLDDYEEVGNGGIIVEKQHIRTKNLRASLSAVEDVSNDKYTIKRHGKIEYRADIDRSSDFKYKYKEGSSAFNDTLHVGALHNISGELGIDIVFPDNYSIFIIYERDQAIDYGHTDNLHIAIGYLPNKNTNYSIQLDSIDNTKSNYVISKNINDFLIDFKLTNHLMRPDDYEEASFNLRRQF
tara:strand:- start:42 stop:2198 length:2157 start_codon:yes stop_codon:yes gene_type:complete